MLLILKYFRWGLALPVWDFKNILMILNQLNNIKTTTSNQFADCIDITIEVNEFDLSLTGDIDHESVVMSGLESHLTLHAYGNKWKVVGSRHTNITN